MLGALIALFCVNDVHLYYEQIIIDLNEIERRIEAGQFKEARELLSRQNTDINRPELRMRMIDMQGLLAMRAKEKNERTGWVSRHFRDRWQESKNDPRYTAWLAEAYFAENRQTEALELIWGLKTKDLMPDAYAYVVLAKLSIGKQRDAALATCKARAVSKKICVIPSKA